MSLCVIRALAQPFRRHIVANSHFVASRGRTRYNQIQVRAMASSASSLPSCLVVGATRGLGLAITRHLVDSKQYNVYATARSEGRKIDGVTSLISGIDISRPESGAKLVEALKGVQLHYLFLVAGYFSKETMDTPIDWEEEIKMYATCAIGPLHIVQSLLHAGNLVSGSKICLITSEGGSITLRTEQEGGGFYGHHASKTAQNMVGKLLSYDLKPKGIPIVMIHPGFLKTELTKSVGFDQYYEAGGAVPPEEAVGPLLAVMEELTVENTGKFIAPLGPKGVGNAFVIGDVEKLPKKNLELPW